MLLITSKKRDTIMIICVLCIAVFVAFVVNMASLKDIGVKAETGSGNYIAFNGKWQNQYGLSYDLAKLYYYESEFSTTEPLVLTRKLNIDEDKVFFFRSNNLVVNVYIEDEVLYFMSDSGVIENLTAFDNYVCIEIPQKYNGKNLKLEIYETVSSLGCCVDSALLGDGEDIILDQLKNYIYVAAIGVLVIVAGVVFILMGILTRKRIEKSSSYIYFGAFLIFFGLCILLDTPWAYLELKNVYLVETASKVFLLAALPMLMMYITSNYVVRNQKILDYMLYFSIGLFPLALILHLTNLVPLFSITLVTHLMIVVASVIIIVEFISYISRAGKAKIPFSRVYYISLMVFLVLAMYDICRYYQNNGGDMYFFTRFGLIILCSTAFAAAAADILSMIQLGLKAGQIGKIAFTDALTGVGNAAAFKSKFEEIDAIKNVYDYVGIIQFDVNNLKIINDTKGHEAGDLLIKSAGEIINETFGKIGDCFRTGGDEFVAITTYKNAPSACDEAIKKFNLLIEKFNEDPNKPFEMRIAYGAAYYKSDDDTNPTLKEVHRLADERMYNNKRELKAKYARNKAEATVR